MADAAYKKGNYHYSYVVGLPRAGDPLAEAFVKRMNGYGIELSLLRMRKIESNGKRQIVPTDDQQFDGEEVLVLDDVVDVGLSKVEAIESLRSLGLRVDQCLVCIDREQGGRHLLNKVGVRLLSLTSITKVFQHLLHAGIVDQSFRGSSDEL